MSISSAGAAFELQFQISPIIMTGGIAGLIPGGALPLLSIASSAVFSGGLLSAGNSALSLDDYFAMFEPLPGATLIDQQIGMYPFANQSVAANAVIQQPLTISMMMTCAAGRGGGYITQQAQLMALQASLDQHNKSGGLYTILTPKFAYIDCVMTSMTDVSRGETRQVQTRYKLDFLKPLVTLADAADAQNALMSQISNGTATDGSQFGPGNVAGNTSGVTGPTYLNGSGQGSMTVPGTGGLTGGEYLSTSGS